MLNRIMFLQRSVSIPPKTSFPMFLKVMGVRKWQCLGASAASLELAMDVTALHPDIQRSLGSRIERIECASSASSAKDESTPSLSTVSIPVHFTEGDRG